MNSAVQLALALIKKYRLEGPPGVYQLYRIARSEGIILTRFPFKGRVRARYVRTGDGIALLTVKKGLTRPELKHMLAYGLGQHCLNVTSGIYVDGLTGRGEEENAAEDFAALLLLPPGTGSAGGGLPEYPRSGRYLSRTRTPGAPSVQPGRAAGRARACGSGERPLPGRRPTGRRETSGMITRESCRDYPSPAGPPPGRPTPHPAPPPEAPPRGCLPAAGPPPFRRAG